MNHFFNAFFDQLPRRQLAAVDDDNDDEFIQQAMEQMTRPRGLWCDLIDEEDDEKKDLEKAVKNIKDEKVAERLLQNRSEVTSCAAIVSQKVSNSTDSREKQTNVESNENLEDKSEFLPLPCVVCEDQSRTILFLDCKHCCACEKCADKLQTCPICRRIVASKVKIIFS